jgi:hypothetical protein
MHVQSAQPIKIVMPEDFESHASEIAPRVSEILHGNELLLSARALGEVEAA